MLLEYRWNDCAAIDGDYVVKKSFDYLEKFQSLCSMIYYVVQYSLSEAEIDRKTKGAVWIARKTP